MSKSQRDIEYEMSRFEEEITKLTPAVPQHVITSAPSNTYSIKPRSVTTGNMGMPSTLGNMGMPSTFSTFNYQQQQFPPNPYMNQTSMYNRPAPQVPMVPKIVTNPINTSAVKRDSSGNIISQNKPTNAAGVATATAVASSQPGVKSKEAKSGKKKKFIRAAGGQTWEDESLSEWNPDDFRLFCGDLGNEVNDESLSRAFQKYPSFQKGKVIRDKKNGKTRGYGFVSFRDSADFIKAMREMNGKYVGNRPIKLRKSNWTDRNIDQVRKKQVEKAKMGLK